MEIFIILLLFVGLVIACIQDLKRKEVDNWVNLFLLFSGAIFIFFQSFLNEQREIIFFIYCLPLIFVFIFPFIFYLSSNKMYEKFRFIFKKKDNFDYFILSIIFFFFIVLLILDYNFLDIRNLFEKAGLFYFYNGLIIFYCLFFLAHLFYYSRIFAGGDAKLMIALFPLFLNVSISKSFVNVFIFLFLLMISGSLYGIIYSIYFYVRDFNKINNKFIAILKNKNFKYVFLILLLFPFIYFDKRLIFILLFIPLSFLLFIFAKSIEKISMVRKVNSSSLKEGDWLAEDFFIGKKKILYSWEGLSKRDIEFIKKNVNFIKIREGIAFVPCFLIAFILYLFKELIFNFFVSLL